MSAFTLQELPTWRKIAISTWKTSSDPSIYGWIELDATALSAYVERARETSGERVTLTHAVGKAAALAFAENPECNAVVSLGRLKRRSSVDVFFSVALAEGKELSGAKLQAVDRLSVVEIARCLGQRVRRIREGGDTELQKSQSMLRRVPALLLRPLMAASAAATFDLELDLSAYGLPFDPFGSVIVTNVGVLGVEQGFAPLIPSGRTSAILTLGKLCDRVIAVNGRPEVRPVLTICGSFDHRVMDGHQLGRLTSSLRRILERPEQHLGQAS